MKYMHIFIIGIFFFTLSSFKVHDNQNLNDDVIEVAFNHTLTFNDIVKIKLDLSERAITLTYNRLVFDENSRLTSISFSVKCDGYGGADEADNLTDDNSIGFFRDYTKGAKKQFGCGNIEKLRLIRSK